MTQRKLDPDELQCVKQALIEMGQISGAWDVYRRIRDMVREGTTDGQPYVDPEPLIPDGYRLAVAGDEGRRDCLFLYCSEWMNREPGGKFMGGYTFIVPADRTPTDEDAKSRPEVMVRNRDDCKWQKYTLLAVFEPRPEIRFMCIYDNGSTYATWKQCRHLYPGE